MHNDTHNGDAQVTMRAKEYVDQLMTAHAKEHQVDVVQLKSQADEYERRLTDLNHAHAQAQADKVAFLTREVYETNHKDLEKRVDKIQEDMNVVTNSATTNKESLAKLESTLAWLSKLVIGSIITALIALVFQVLNRTSAPGVGI